MVLNFGQNHFPGNPNNNKIISYSSLDVAQGVGYVTFYGGRTTSSNATASFATATSSFSLSSNKFYSDQIASGASKTNGGADLAWYTMQDINFDIKFIQPSAIGGQCVVNVPIGILGGAGASGIQTVAAVSLQKLSNNAVSILAHASGAPLVVNTGTFYTMNAIPLQIPLTAILKNDILRLKVRQQMQVNGNFTGTAYLAYDPQNRSFSGAVGTTAWPSGETSELSINIPFKIDL